MKPNVSVIMSVYNGEDYLAETLDSILNQTYQNWELIAINDCSTDSTSQILADYASKDQRIRVFTNETNLRLPASLNKAISFSCGKYIARMDADDICLSDRLEKQVRFMEENADVALSSCKFFTLKNGVYTPGAVGGRCDSKALKAMLLVTNPILHPGVIAKAEVMKELLYDTSRTCTEDLELWTRFAKSDMKIQILPEFLLLYRLHDKQITSTTLERQHKEVLEIEQNYYAALAEKMPEERKEFYISGIYFKENANIEEFLSYAKWLRAAAKKNFDSEAIEYALLEMLAEYKRCGVSKAHILKAMLHFNPIFLAKDMLRRKKTAKHEIEKCIAVAKKLGIRPIGGTKTFPIFGK
jgi:glycosyltransferase involved in cell wall biosynthesis